jgi:hypothetical protein
VRQLITHAAEGAGLDPDRLSFTTALRLARRAVTGRLGTTARTLAAASASVYKTAIPDATASAPRGQTTRQPVQIESQHQPPRTSTNVSYTITLIDAGGP